MSGNFKLTKFEKEIFEEKGYLIFESILGDDECKQLKLEIDSLQIDTSILPVQKPHLANLITNSKIIHMTQSLMDNKPYVFHHLHSARHDAGTPTFPWHHDYEQYPQVNRKYKMIHYFMYINGLNGTIGDLLVVPGTHKLVYERYQFSELGDQDIETMVTIDKLAKGSVIAIHSALIHARKAKPGGEKVPRYFIDCSYCECGPLWPPYKERGDWKKILKELNKNKGNEYPHLFNEQCFLP